ncbi:hypothetical protein DNTS_006342 [Danionella cerebrum]|uniref:Uncharacterized protein n=1 Tax=Danionella cerebrum TaxID=2873325 RepID=A0A553Q5C9_9TELE|nr:hypothetical protein DNTS_006342 [Danionella translucida]
MPECGSITRVVNLNRPSAGSFLAREDFCAAIDSISPHVINLVYIQPAIPTPHLSSHITTVLRESARAVGHQYVVYIERHDFSRDNIELFFIYHCEGHTLFKTHALGYRGNLKPDPAPLLCVSNVPSAPPLPSQTPRVTPRLETVPPPRDGVVNTALRIFLAALVAIITVLLMAVITAFLSILIRKINHDAMTLSRRAIPDVEPSTRETRLLLETFQDETTSWRIDLCYIIACGTSPDNFMDSDKYICMLEDQKRNPSPVCPSWNLVGWNTSPGNWGGTPDKAKNRIHKGRSLLERLSIIRGKTNRPCKPKQCNPLIITLKDAHVLDSMYLVVGVYVSGTDPMGLIKLRVNPKLEANRVKITSPQPASENSSLIIPDRLNQQYGEIPRAVGNGISERSFKMTKQTYDRDAGERATLMETFDDALTRPIPKERYSKYHEKRGDLFDCPYTSSLAHCVAADMVMRRGIASAFLRRFGSVDYLLAQKKRVGQCAVLFRNGRYIFYLVTRNFDHEQPTYADIRKCIIDLRDKCVQLRVSQLCMPRLCFEHEGIRVVTVTAVRSETGFEDGRLICSPGERTEELHTVVFSQLDQRLDQCGWTFLLGDGLLILRLVQWIRFAEFVAVVVWTFMWGVSLGIDPRPVGAPAAWPPLLKYY